VNISRLEILEVLSFLCSQTLALFRLAVLSCLDAYASLVSFSIFSISSSYCYPQSSMYYILVFMRFIRQYTGVVIAPFRLPFFPAVCNMLPRCDRCTPNQHTIPSFSVSNLIESTKLLQSSEYLAIITRFMLFSRILYRLLTFRSVFEFLRSRVNACHA
jgi:hypothetical protein